MTIPALPDAPLLSDSPEQFNTKAFAFVAALDDIFAPTKVAPATATRPHVIIYLLAPSVSAKRQQMQLNPFHHTTVK